MDDFRDFVCGLLLYIVGTGFGFILGGLALSTLWGWFIVPTFGLPALGLVPAMGVSLIVQYLTAPTTISTESETFLDDFYEKMFKSIVSSTLMFGFIMLTGWCIHQFM